MPSIYQALQQGLANAKALQSPADVHGTLTGMLCANTQTQPDQAVETQPNQALSQALAALKEMTLQGLESEDMDFALILPADEQALEQRVQALSSWSAGFLYGLSSQPQGAQALNLDQLSKEAREIISDISQISRVGLSEQDAQQLGAEADFTELAEYVRMGVQMVYIEMRPQKPHVNVASDSTFH